jgi:putative transposase
MTRQLVEEAVSAGARREQACARLGLSARTVERWRDGAVEDGRQGPSSSPANKLSNAERAEVVSLVTSPRFRDLSPNQIVPLLADEGRFVASESTVYRVLREQQLLRHRGRAKPPQRRATSTHEATGPNQVWSWDITYLKSPVRGAFFYLYAIVDVWSRKLVGWAVHDAESADHAARLFQSTCEHERLDPRGVVLHADNGGPMKGSTMVATLERLGVLASFSRPGVSDDNPYSEALFRTLKYRPEFPSKPFIDIEDARSWVERFVRWYNDVHLHSGISFVTPAARHNGHDVVQLARRHDVYRKARERNPHRWTKTTRDWGRVEKVVLHPAGKASVTSTEKSTMTTTSASRSTVTTASPTPQSGVGRGGAGSGASPGEDGAGASTEPAVRAGVEAPVTASPARPATAAPTHRAGPPARRPPGPRTRLAS